MSGADPRPNTPNGPIDRALERIWAWPFALARLLAYIALLGTALLHHELVGGTGDVEWLAAATGAALAVSALLLALPIVSVTTWRLVSLLIDATFPLMVLVFTPALEPLAAIWLGWLAVRGLAQPPPAIFTALEPFAAAVIFLVLTTVGAWSDNLFAIGNAIAAAAVVYFWAALSAAWRGQAVRNSLVRRLERLYQRMTTFSPGDAERRHEWEQAVTRVAFTLFVAVAYPAATLIFGGAGYDIPVRIWAYVVVVAYLAFSIWVLLRIHRRPISPRRRELLMYLDVAMSWVVIYGLGAFGAVGVFFALWVTIGYPMRYGWHLGAVLGLSPLLAALPAWQLGFPLPPGDVIVMILACFGFLAVALYMAVIGGRLRHAQQQAAERLQLLTEFVGDATHEVRNVLQPVESAMSAQRLRLRELAARARGHFHDELAEAIAGLERAHTTMSFASERLDELLRSVARSADIDRHEPWIPRITLPGLLNRVHSNLSTEAHERYRGYIAVDASAPPVIEVVGHDAAPDGKHSHTILSATFLHSILFEAVSNARRQLRLKRLSSHRSAPGQDYIMVTIARRGRALLFTVTDTGLGFDPNDRDELFRDGVSRTASDELGRRGHGRGLASILRYLKPFRGEVHLEPRMRGSRCIGAVLRVEVPLDNGLRGVDDAAVVKDYVHQRRIVFAYSALTMAPQLATTSGRAAHVRESFTDAGAEAVLLEDPAAVPQSADVLFLAEDDEPKRWRNAVGEGERACVAVCPHPPSGQALDELARRGFVATVAADAPPQTWLQAAAYALAAVVSQAPEVRADATGMRIVVLDDDAAVVRGLEEELSALGATVESIDALDDFYVRLLSDEPLHGLIVDHRLGLVDRETGRHLNGYEVLRKARDLLVAAHRPMPPALILSGSVDIDVDALWEDGIGFLAKPVLGAEVVKALRGLARGIRPPTAPVRRELEARRSGTVRPEEADVVFSARDLEFARRPANIARVERWLDGIDAAVAAARSGNPRPLVAHVHHIWPLFISGAVWRRDPGLRKRFDDWDDADRLRARLADPAELERLAADLEAYRTLARELLAELRTRLETAPLRADDAAAR